ncbi:MAG TPA: (d)CMP kinase [Desulfobacterales bacterium]|nr:(d)CMP kinase [Desulfobacterales bacterium]
MNQRPDIITIDGPSGSGKSTLSRLLAAELGYTYLDTGAMYRAVGLQVKNRHIDLEDDRSLKELLTGLELELLPGGGDSVVILDGHDVSRAIRSAEMGMMASKVSGKPLVRERLTALQRQMAVKGRVVAEGRDTGTVVFPLARCKFFLEAAAEERARRRTEQLRQQGMSADYDDILAQIKKRDADDSGRQLAPLKPAADALLIDCTKMDIAAVLNLMLDKVSTAAG